MQDAELSVQAHWLAHGLADAGAGAGAGTGTGVGAGAGAGTGAGAGFAVADGIPVAVPPVASTRQIERNVLISAAPAGLASTFSKQELHAAALAVTVGHAQASSGHVLTAARRLSQAPAQGSV